MWARLKLSVIPVPYSQIFPTSFMHGYLLLKHLHMLSGLLLMIGVVLFLIWAAKNLKKDQLKKWSMWLVVIGLVGGVVTAKLSAKWKGYEGKHAVLQEVLSEKGVTFSEEEWEEIYESVREKMKHSWKKLWNDDDEDEDEDDEGEG